MEFKGDVSYLQYQTEKSACFDIRAKLPPRYTVSGDECVGEVVLSPGDRKLFKTGLFLDVANSDANEVLMIFPRSGIALKYGVTLCNNVGIIDADYPEEIGVILINHGQEPFIVRDGDRIAQGMVMTLDRVVSIPIKNVQRTSGFGSSGTV